ncbi:MAG: phosphomannomutase/phosphoglucomutase [Clostridia bacterium]|nr:phosphomannomutase/phosphoglucomutase [Clostridia bacterium]
MQINPEIFRSYDIRGLVGSEITGDTAEKLGKAFGTYVQELNEKTVIVGNDNRESSTEFNKRLIQGLTSTGVDVINIGLATTPMVYYARKLFDIGPAIQITASHNPAEYNGFKMCIEKEAESIYGNRIQEIRKYAEKEIFKQGSGKVVEENILDNYIEQICEKVKLGDRKLKVVVDAGNGTTYILAEKLLQKLGVDVIPLFCTSDASFPNHHPDPSIPENLVDLSKKVVEEKADLGIGYDGDGDRIGIVDENGNMIFGDLFMLIMWREIIKNHPGARALVEVKCTQSLWDELEKIGAKPEFIRTGSPYIKAAMKEKDVPFSGEMSGHIFFRDEYYGFDDAAYATARILRLLSNTDKNVSELLDGINKYVATPEITKTVDDSRKFEIIEKAKEYFKQNGFTVIDVDGARVVFDTGWGLIRASNTSPKITIRYEAKTEEDLVKIQAEFEKCFEEIF